MLSQLTIRNFAIVDRLQVDWHAGLNVITGETGAGKSILIDAVGALLGDRLGPEVVRVGAARALVEGVFTIPDQPRPELKAVLEEYGLEPEDGALIVSRELAGTGSRGSARVNGRAVTLSALQELGEVLVDIHGQSAHMALLRAREQLEYLDRYAGTLSERAEVAGLVRELRALRARLQELASEERDVARTREMLLHETGEIEAAGLREGEEEELLVQRARLEHAERLRETTRCALEALTGAEDSERERAGAIDLLSAAVTACAEAGRIDPELTRESEALTVALAQTEESARSLRDYLDSVEADPRTLDRVVERLFLLADLKRKYGETISDILGYAEAAGQRLDALEHRAERLADLQLAEQALKDRLLRAARQLSERRAEAAARLSRAVETELHDLRLGGARFAVTLTPTGEPDVTGADRIELMLAARGDDEPRPMARVASGGELARLALALKTVLAAVEPRPTLIFDEIDVGIGSRAASVVGEKLWTVAASGNQVLCVTHLAQVAAFAEHHYAVNRQTAETVVSELDAEQRVEELAAMLAGTVTESARESARELLGRSAERKRSWDHGNC